MVALDTHRSLRRAAADIALTQPAATKLLHDLEDAPRCSSVVGHVAPPMAKRAARARMLTIREAAAAIAALRSGARGPCAQAGDRLGARFLAPAIARCRTSGVSS